MLLREGEARTFVMDRRLGCSLAAVAGAVNAAGFLAVGYYSANMTGNLSSLSMDLRAVDLSSAVACLGLIAAFVAGAVLSAFLVNAGRRHGRPAIYAYSILLEALLLALLGALDIALRVGPREPVLAYGLSFLMGLQNATVTRISGARVRTTHMTGMLTDFGIELADWLDAVRRPGDPGRMVQVRERLALHGGIVLSFACGGVGGALAYGWWRAGALLGLAPILVWLALPGAMADLRDRLSGPIPPGPVP
ncbi:DUF1275 family protein [Gluconacetobacter liquefaciens]|uniref:DUF1275 domain-containing protein n=1 Tax=Gluconacetobacter liquefaciens TaxID=89584 RepID=A0A370G6E7_GLULI|nr:YoaK family protein [Gluconacetobacter liquefaciens]MBB2185582.1 DUF1275 domain-containing protein [Gluconacetobacter liquefaciens]RDI39387.1 uncharacterized membrane protein YoaK (UPF0700 family) [Gluconacetobacter liquefaciens]GEB36028.1 DUF1275 family protein [Gluconacetobacter liquefaciens]